MSLEPTFDRFLDAVQGTNPFLSNRITDPDRDEPTVESIHEAEFNKLVRIVGDASKTPASVGVLVIGAPGVGKSHLLARLVRWAREDRATVVYLHNILASPERMLRYVLQATVSDLIGRGGYAESKLYAILNRALIKRGAIRGPKLKRQDIDVRREALEKLGRELDPHGSVIRALNAFLDGTSLGVLGDAGAEDRARAAVHWISGESIGQEEAELLAVPEGDPVGVQDDAAAEHVFSVLARLCAFAERPLVLCLDQVDNLDPDGAHALASYAHALLDRGKHLVVITSGVKQSMLALRTDQVIPTAAWDRIAERTLDLHMVSPDEARAILAKRLDATLTAFDKVDEVIEARSRDALFPLGNAWLTERLGSVDELRPRDVILWARDRWEAQQDRLRAVGGRAWMSPAEPRTEARKPEPLDLHAIIDAEVRKKHIEGVKQRDLERASLPPDADNLASLTHRILSQTLGRGGYTLVSIERTTAKKKTLTPAYHLLAKEKRADGVTVNSGVTFVCAPSGHGVWGPLSRMAEDEHPPHHRILVTDDERRPLKLGGAGKVAYEKLCKAGRRAFLHIRLDFARYAELDSLVGLLGAARSQDLEVEYPRSQYRKVTEDEVVMSFHRQNLLLAHPLLRELLTEDVGESLAPPAPEVAWDTQRTREHIMAELGWRLGFMAKELAQIFATKNKVPSAQFGEAWRHVKTACEGLHREGHVHATAQDDDLFVQLRGKR